MLQSFVKTSPRLFQQYKYFGVSGQSPASRLPATKATTSAYIIHLTFFQFDLYRSILVNYEIYLPKGISREMQVKEHGDHVDHSPNRASLTIII